MLRNIGRGKVPPTATRDDVAAVVQELTPLTVHARPSATIASAPCGLPFYCFEHKAAAPGELGSSGEGGEA